MFKDDIKLTEYDYEIQNEILEYEDYKDLKTPELADYCKNLIEKNLN